MKHRWVPVPLAIGEKEREPQWRCVHCGVIAQEPRDGGCRKKSAA